MKELEQFGDRVMKEVRDEGIRYWDAIRKGEIKAEVALKINELFIKNNLSEDMEWIAPLIVDSCVAKFLRMIEQEDDISIFFKGLNIKNLSDGLVGELYGENGWVAKLSCNPASKLTE